MKVLFLLITVLSLAISIQAQSDTCNNNDALVVNTAGSKNNRCIPLNQQPAGTGTTMVIPNDTVTGTTVNRLAKLTGAPSQAIITATTDTENAVGVVTSGAGTTGNATITILGQASCAFDGATTAGNYVVISSVTAGMCHDGGSSFPTAQAAYGRVLSTNGGAGTYVIELMTPDIAFQNGGNGKSRPGGALTNVQFFDTGSQFGGSSTFVWDKTNQALTVGGSGSVDGSFTVKDRTGRLLLLQWNGSAQTVNSNGLDLWLFSGNIYMFAGSSQRWQFASNGHFIPSGSDGGFDIGNSTHHVRDIYFTNLIGNSNERVYSGGAPSITGDGTLNTGSKDSAGKVTSTTTGAASIVLTFSTSFQNAPACFANNETTANMIRATSTTTQVTIAGTTVTGDVVSYGCTGY